MTKPNGTTQLYRIEQLEKSYVDLDNKMDRILTNDFPYLHEAITGLKTKINVLTAVNIGAIAIALAISRLIK